MLPSNSMNKPGIKAVEFFSGIGAFAYVCREVGIEVVAAFDQGEDANSVYGFNFGRKPSSRNLDSIDSSKIPDAQMWWMSPPCTPYSVRGLRRDAEDPRAESLKNLTGLIKHKMPSVIIVENVLAFRESQMYQRLTAGLDSLRYEVRTSELCPTQFGIPMKRPRLFITALLPPFGFVEPAVQCTASASLTAHLSDANDDRLMVAQQVVERHKEGMHLVSPADPDASTICFTSGYAKSFRASGSFIKSESGIRRFSPGELLRLFGFGCDFTFPDDLPLQAQWRLIGNSVELRCIRHVLSSVERVPGWVEL